VESTDCSPGTGLGTTTQLTESRVGALELPGDEWLSKTYRGSRVTSNGIIVNQNITSTFDPATLTCLTCTVPHNIIPRDGSGMVLILGDQNFVSAIVGKNHCIPVVRVEDASLAELFKICLEILDRNPLPLSTHFLVGSASHLAKVGSTLYCLEWQRMVGEFTNRWLGATVGPLPPVLRDQTSPGICKQVTEIKHWFDRIYTGNISYQGAAWGKLMTILSNPPDTGIDLGKEEIYTIAMPISLTDPTLKPVKFHVNSCHAATAIFGGVATDELTCALLDQLTSNFSCNAHSGDYLAREPAELGGATADDSSPKTVLFVGGSHCRRIADEFQNLGYKVIDKSVPGWQPTQQNISLLESDLTALGNLQGVIVICDLVSNITYRYKQMDGQLLLPVKMAGRYHILGEVTTVTKELLTCILKKLKPVLDLLPGVKICISPLPRYLHTPCCKDLEHCVGTEQLTHAAELLGQVAKVRKHLKDHLTSVHANMFVPDFLTMMFPGCSTHDSVSQALKHLTMSDGVHLTKEGYRLLADTVNHYIENKIASSCVVSGPGAGEKPAAYYWRGFSSPVGAARPERKAFYHENRAGGGKIQTLRGGMNNRGGRSYPPGGRNWN